MKCNIACCSRDAVVLITFRYGRKSHPFCQFHAYDRVGKLRWGTRAVRNVLRSGRA